MSWVRFPSAPPCDVSRHRNLLNLRAGGSSLFEAWLVAAFGVEGEVAEEFAGLGGDDADVEVVDEHDDRCSFEWPADGDVVHASGAAE